MKYALRPATEDDYDFLYDLHRTTIRAAVDATWGWDEAFQQARFREHFDPAETEIVVVDGQDAGVLKLEKREQEFFLDLIEIAVPMQGQGVGTQIILDILKMARERQVPVGLHVLKANPLARRLYQRLGFVVIEEQEERFVMQAPPTTP